MAKKRYINTRAIFLWQYIYDQVVPEDHFFEFAKSTDQVGSIYKAAN